jgi:hypothetical protein
MLVQISGPDADKNNRNQQPRDPATILAVMAGVLWSLGLLQYAQWHAVERQSKQKIQEQVIVGSGRASEGFTASRLRPVMPRSSSNGAKTSSNEQNKTPEKSARGRS